MTCGDGWLEPMLAHKKVSGSNRLSIRVLRIRYLVISQLGVKHFAVLKQTTQTLPTPHNSKALAAQ